MPPKHFKLSSLPSVNPPGGGGGAHGPSAATDVTARNLTRVSSADQHEYPLSPAALGNVPMHNNNIGIGHGSGSNSNGNSAPGSHGNTPPRVRGNSPASGSPASLGGGGSDVAGGGSSASTNSSPNGPSPTMGRPGVARLDFIQSMQSRSMSIMSQPGGTPLTPSAVGCAVTPLHGAGGFCGAGGQVHHQQHALHTLASPSAAATASLANTWQPGRCVRLAANVKRVALDAVGTYNVVKSISCPHRAGREWDHYNTAPMHPSVLRYLKYKRYDNGGADVTMEYANRGTLAGILAELNERIGVVSPLQPAATATSTPSGSNPGSGVGGGAASSATSSPPRPREPSGCGADDEANTADDAVSISTNGNAGRAGSSTSHNASLDCSGITDANTNDNDGDPSAAGEQQQQQRQQQRCAVQATREELAKAVARQILDALLYYERVHNRWHRDVKPDNILCRSDGVLKLSDFDVSRQASCTMAGGRTTTGTPDYMAPDYVRAAGSIDRYVVDPGKADVWSIGCVLYQIVFGQLPFPKRNAMELVSPEAVAELHRTMLCGNTATTTAKVLDPQLRALLRRCLVWRSENRASLAEASAITYLFFCNDSNSSVTFPSTVPSPPAAASTAAAAASSSFGDASAVGGGGRSSSGSVAATTPTRTALQFTAPSAACEQCVQLCDCTLERCGDDMLCSAACVEALDRYGVDLSRHPLEKQAKDAAAASEIGAGEAEEGDVCVAAVASTIQRMLDAVVAEMETVRRCHDATKLDQLPLQPRSPSASAAAAPTNNIGGADPTAFVPLPPRETSYRSLSHTASSASLDATATAATAPYYYAGGVGERDGSMEEVSRQSSNNNVVNPAVETQQQPAPQQQQQPHARVYSPVAPGQPVGKLDSHEARLFHQRFNDFASAYRLPSKTAERTLQSTMGGGGDTKKPCKLTEEDVVLKAVRSSVSEEMRKHWSERSKPAYAATKHVLSMIDAQTMQGAAPSSRGVAGAESFVVNE